MSSAGRDVSKLPLVPGRECGACQVCCVALTVDTPELQKMPGSACRHCRNPGCGVYETRWEICRTFYCGWRRLATIPADWRPDLAGIVVLGEENDLPQFQPLALTLFLTGNPLKTVRRPDFLDYVMSSVRNRVSLYLMLPSGAKGMKPAKLHLNSALADARSRGEVKALLEASLKTHRDLPLTPYVMENSGNDVST